MSFYSTDSLLDVSSLISRNFRANKDSLEDALYFYVKVEILGEICQDSLVLHLTRASHHPKVISESGASEYQYNISSNVSRRYVTPYDLKGAYRVSRDELIDGNELYVLHEFRKGMSRVYHIDKVHVYEEGVEFGGAFAHEWRSNFNVSIIFIGFSFFIIIFGLSMYFLSKEREYAYYILSAITGVLYLTTYDIGFDHFLFYSVPSLYGQALITYQFLIYIFYYLFAYHFLDMKQQYPKLAIIIRWTVLLLVLLLLTYFIISYINKRDSLYMDILGYIVTFHRLVLVVVGVYSMYYLIRYAKSKLPYYIVTGSVFFTIGSLMYLFYGSKNFQIYGTTAEMIVFSIGLAYKYHINISRVQELNLKTVNLKLEALLSQLNPHFIFNSLNTVHSLVGIDKKQEAMKYIMGFSKFLRRSLDLSREQNSSLASDIELTSSYLNLEKIRYSEDFSFEIEVDPRIDLENEVIPCLLTQPFLENVIKHGLSSTNTDSKGVKVTYKLYNEDLILCEIEDNGPGIDEEKLSAITNNQLTRSYGITLAMDRLKYFDQKGISKIEFYNKKIELDGETGLRVSVYIPRIN